SQPPPTPVPDTATSETAAASPDAECATQSPQCSALKIAAESGSPPVRQSDPRALRSKTVPPFPLMPATRHKETDVPDAHAPEPENSYRQRPRRRARVSIRASVKKPKQMQST